MSHEAEKLVIIFYCLVNHIGVHWNDESVKNKCTSQKYCFCLNPILSQIQTKSVYTQHIHAQPLQLNTDKAVIVESFDIVNKEEQQQQQQTPHQQQT